MPHSIRAVTLIWPFGLLPVLSMLWVWDLTWGGEQIRDALPRSPQSLLLFSLFFGLPHIIAGHIALLDREYYGAYRHDIRRTGSLALLLALLTAVALPPALGLLLFNVITVHHTCGQQIGMARGLMRSQAPRLHAAWRACSLALVVAVSLAMFVPGLMHADPGRARALWGAIEMGVLVSTGLAIALIQRQPRRGGWIYIACTQCLFVLCAQFALTGYYLFAALAPQVVHDLNAYAMYIRHDQARRREQPQANALYRWLRVPASAIPLVLPMLASGMAFMMANSMLQIVGLWCSYLHYLLEATLWKRGSPHRRHVGFAP